MKKYGDKGRDGACSRMTSCPTVSDSFVKVTKSNLQWPCTTDFNKPAACYNK